MVWSGEIHEVLRTHLEEIDVANKHTVGSTQIYQSLTISIPFVYFMSPHDLFARRAINPNLDFQVLYLCVRYFLLHDQSTVRALLKLTFLSRLCPMRFTYSKHSQTISSQFCRYLNGRTSIPHFSNTQYNYINYCFGCQKEYRLYDFERISAFIMRHHVVYTKTLYLQGRF